MTRNLRHVATLLSTACASMVPIKDPITLAEVANGQNSAAKNGVTITVTPIDARNYAGAIPEYTFKGSLRICQQEGGGFSEVRTYPIPTPVFDDCCTFRVRIANGTGHTLALAGATIQLEDGRGRTYEAISSVHEAAGYKKVIGSATQSGQLPLIQALGAVAQSSMEVPGPATKILPGKRFDGILSFNASQGAAPYKLLFYDLVTATDDAGNPKNRDNFEFAVQTRRVEMYRTLDNNDQVMWSQEDPGSEQCK